MVTGKGELHSDAGQDCPAQEPFEAPTEITVNGERLRIIQATPTELAAITQCLKERAESAPAGVHIGRASALVRTGLKFAAVVLLAAGVGVGLGDGNVFDDAGCSVAQQPRRVSHGEDSGQAGENPGGKAPVSDGGYGGSLEILREMRLQRDLIEGLVRRQEKLLAMGLPVAAAEPRLGIQTIGANKELRTIGRFKYGAGFKDVWLGDEHYDLRGRAKARFCIQYLVAKQAFNADSARHLEHEIDPFVRKKCQLPPPSEIRIQHYFNDRSGKLSRLRGDLVKAAGRNGRFYLRVV